MRSPSFSPERASLTLQRALSAPLYSPAQTVSPFLLPALQKPFRRYAFCKMPSNNRVVVFPVGKGEEHGWLDPWCLLEFEWLQSSEPSVMAR